MSLKATWERVLEYASSPKHGTLSRKLRKGVKLKVNNDTTFENSTLFMGDEFFRITQKEKDEVINAYYDWKGITTIQTISNAED